MFCVLLLMYALYLYKYIYIDLYSVFFHSNRYFFMEITVKTTNHGHIRDQKVTLSKNSCFVFNFMSFEFLTVFSTAILTGSWWRGNLKWNSKPSYNSIFSNFQFQENRIKTMAVTVLPWRVEHMAVVTSSNMLMS